jgi:hypothetical protein
MKQSKLLWLLVLPSLLATTFFFLKLNGIYLVIWPALMDILRKMYLTSEISTLFFKFSIIIILFVTFLLLTWIVFSYINKRKRTGNILLALLVLIISLNYTFRTISTTKQKKINNITNSAKSVVDDLVKKNPILSDELCKTVRILKKIDDNTYKAIATMESETEYLIEIEDLGEYIQVRLLPSIDITN